MRRVMFSGCILRTDNNLSIPWEADYVWHSPPTFDMHTAIAGSQGLCCDAEKEKLEQALAKLQKNVEEQNENCLLGQMAMSLLQEQVEDLQSAIEILQEEAHGLRQDFKLGLANNKEREQENRKLNEQLGELRTQLLELQDKSDGLGADGPVVKIVNHAGSQTDAACETWPSPSADSQSSDATCASDDAFSGGEPDLDSTCASERDLVEDAKAPAALAAAAGSSLEDKPKAEMSMRTGFKMPAAKEERPQRIMDEKRALGVDNSVASESSAAASQASASPPKALPAVRVTAAAPVRSSEDLRRAAKALHKDKEASLSDKDKKALLERADELLLSIFASQLGEPWPEQDGECNEPEMAFGTAFCSVLFRRKSLHEADAAVAAVPPKQPEECSEAANSDFENSQLSQRHLQSEEGEEERDEEDGEGGEEGEAEMAEMAEFLRALFGEDQLAE
ncbi:unnamed protein product [Symbiodinium natans]|uniref:Uncharacterized protein n=1 Tax=Symbiodinium natans TaxID=878477 RepID=A0A812MH86_9DINO|nr:unnamed protein product [Symbiodinium natans]